MSILASIGALGGIISAVSGVIEKLVPDPDLKVKLQTQMQLAVLDKQADLDKAVLEAARMQVEVNLKEAESPSLFVAGWRPFIGWVCGVAFACTFLVQPFFTWVSAMFGGPAFPTLDSATLMSLTMGLLGLGTMRTVEKFQGVERQTMATPAPAAAAKQVKKTGIIPLPPGDRT